MNNLELNQKYSKHLDQLEAATKSGQITINVALAKAFIAGGEYAEEIDLLELRLAAEEMG